MKIMILQNVEYGFPPGLVLLGPVTMQTALFQDF